MIGGCTLSHCCQLFWYSNSNRLFGTVFQDLVRALSLQKLMGLYSLTIYLYMQVQCIQAMKKVRIVLLISTGIP